MTAEPGGAWQSAGEDLEADVELGCRGMRCRLPIIRLAYNIGDVAIAQTVAVVADGPGQVVRGTRRRIS